MQEARLELERLIAEGNPDMPLQEVLGAFPYTLDPFQQKSVESFLQGELVCSKGLCIPHSDPSVTDSVQFVHEQQEWPSLPNQSLPHVRYAGLSVVVSAPTGAGKTAIAEAAAIAVLARGQRVIYTTPLKVNDMLSLPDASTAYYCPLVVMLAEQQPEKCRPQRCRR